MLRQSTYRNNLKWCRKHRCSLSTRVFSRMSMVHLLALSVLEVRWIKLRWLKWRRHVRAAAAAESYAALLWHLLLYCVWANGVWGRAGGHAATCTSRGTTGAELLVPLSQAEAAAPDPMTLPTDAFDCSEPTRSRATSYTFGIVVSMLHVVAKETRRRGSKLKATLENLKRWRPEGQLEMGR